MMIGYHFSAIAIIWFFGDPIAIVIPDPKNAIGNLMIADRECTRFTDCKMMANHF